MNLFNSTARIITYRDPEAGVRVKLLPGNNDVRDEIVDKILKLLPGHFAAGHLAKSAVEAAQLKAALEAKKLGREPAKKADEGEGDAGSNADISEIFDIDELQKLLKATDDKDRKAAIKAQIKAVKDSE